MKKRKTEESDEERNTKKLKRESDEDKVESNESKTQEPKIEKDEDGEVVTLGKRKYKKPPPPPKATGLKERWKAIKMRTAEEASSSSTSSTSSSTEPKRVKREPLSPSSTKSVVSKPAKSAKKKDRALMGPQCINSKNKSKAKQYVRKNGQYKTEVQNVVSKSHCEPPLPISETPRTWAAATYEKKRFPAASTAIKYPPASISQYVTGQFGTAGSLTENSALLATMQWALAVARQRQEEMTMTAHAAVNFTTSSALGIRLDLIQLYRYLKPNTDLLVTFDPGKIQSIQLRASRIKFPGSSIACNLFATGRLCKVGFKSLEEIENSLPLDEFLLWFARTHPDESGDDIVEPASPVKIELSTE